MLKPPMLPPMLKPPMLLRQVPIIHMDHLTVAQLMDLLMVAQLMDQLTDTDGKFLIGNQ